MPSCSCAFTETDAETLTDHLLEVFTPDDNKGSDGKIHEEGSPTLTCLCGVAAPSPEELDGHFLRLLTPRDQIGRDGTRHEPS